MVKQKESQQHPKMIGKWHIQTRLGEGSFGNVYLVSVPVKGTKKLGFAAMKVEARQKSKFDELMRMEVYVLQKVQVADEEHQRYFCTIHDQGQTDKFNYLVITLLGKPLEDLRRMQPGRKFSAVSTLKIGIQLMCAFKKMHEAGFIHRDVKPLNMAPGFKRQGMIYLFDFGLARFIYTDETKKELRKPRHKASFRGTHRYCSLNAHRNQDQGRVDDIWGVLYCLIEFVTGKLPWSGVGPKEKEKMKETLPDAELFKGCPPSFLRIKNDISGLGFFDEPKYMEYAVWMHGDIGKSGGTLHSNFEWQQPGHRNVLALDGGGKEEKDERGAVREGGETTEEDDSIRTLDSLFSSSRHSSNKNSTAATDEMTIDDTLDDLPDEQALLLNQQTRKQKKRQQMNGAAGKSTKTAADADGMDGGDN